MIYIHSTEYFAEDTYAVYESYNASISLYHLYHSSKFHSLMSKLSLLRNASKLVFFMKLSVFQ